MFNIKLEFLIILILLIYIENIYSQSNSGDELKECQELYNLGKLEDAYNCYIQYENIYAFYNAALISQAQGYSKDFKKLSKKLISKKYISSESYRLYACLYKNDTLKYLKIIDKGLSKFKNDTILLTEKLNYYITDQDYKNMISTANELLKYKKTKSETFFYSNAYAYQMLNMKEEAIHFYQKAIESDSLYFDAWYSIASIYYNNAVELYKNANVIPFNQKEKYENTIKSAEEEFRKAIPYFIKANEIDPKDLTLLNALKTIYYRLKMMPEYEKVKNIIEESDK